MTSTTKYYACLAITDLGLLRILTSSNSLFLSSHRLLVQSQDPRRGRLLRRRRRLAVVVIAVFHGEGVPDRSKTSKLRTRLSSLCMGGRVEFTSLTPWRSRGCRRRHPIGVGRGVIATGAV